MKKSLGISLVILSISFCNSCKEKPVPPVLSTNSMTEISATTAVSGGVISDDGRAQVTSKGVCWNTSDSPTIENSKTTESGQSVSFASNLSQLLPKTTYWVRAYAINEAGTGYGKSVSFTTLEDKPVLNTQNTSNIQLSSATLNGSVNPNSYSTNVNFEWGTTTNYGNTVACAQSPVTGSNYVNVAADLSGLTPGTIYHFRIKAENSLGVTYSSDMIFKTLGDVPSATTLNANNIQVSAATINGSVNPNFLSSKVDFEWGKTADYGNTIAYIQNPITGNIPVSVTANLSGLAPGTTYHFRIKAENSLGVTSGNDMIFKTLGDAPSATISNVSNIGVRSSTISGSVNPNYLLSTINVEWGATTGYGNSVTAIPSPETGNTPVNISADLSGLLPGTTYHVRIKAENSIGTSYSSDLSFTTAEIEWTKSSDFPGQARSLPLSFTYNGKGYFGLGRNPLGTSVDNLNDFWTFDPVTSVWTRLTDCPFTFISSLSTKCLVGSTLYVFKEYSLYSYDINMDNWEFICNTGISLSSMSCFSVEGKAFFFNKSKSELYEFFPQEKIFRKKSSIINGYLDWGLSETFVINNEVFLIHKNDTKIEIYHYIYQSDAWEKKLEKVFSNLEFDLASFIITIDNCAFIGQSSSFYLSGSGDNVIVTPRAPSSNVWKYDYLKNEFKQCPSLPGEFKALTGCFSFEKNGYVVSGVTVDSNTQNFRYLNDIWILNR